MKLNCLPISFVQHKVSASAEVSLAHLQEVDQSTWSCNDDLNSVLEVAHLRSFRCTAKDTGILNLRSFSKIIGNLLNLKIFKRKNQIKNSTLKNNGFF
jgi:hypothetical protein